MLGPQNGQGPRLHAEVRAARREEGDPGHLQRRGHDHAEAATRTFAKLYGAKFPKAVKKITDDQDQLLAFYDFPAEHWIHLRTTNAIESAFSTVRLRTRVTRGAGSRTAALAMVFKLVESAQQPWRAVNAPHLVALVRAEARFEGGRLRARPTERSARRSSACGRPPARTASTASSYTKPP
ncbi:transposase-like protein [Streptomyces sp. B4I13]|nr:transposase-like protein [Streptomyces sp. B4I13]